MLYMFLLGYFAFDVRPTDIVLKSKSTLSVYSLTLKIALTNRIYFRCFTGKRTGTYFERSINHSGVGISFHQDARATGSFAEADQKEGT